MPKSTLPKGKQSKPDSNITAAQIGIVAAILTLVGTVASAIFSYLSVRAPLEISIQATQTAEAKTLTLSPNLTVSKSTTVSASTPVSVAATPIPQSTSQTVVPTSTPFVVQTQVSKFDGMTMLNIPTGSFMMGSNIGNEDEKPVHSITLDAFWIDRTEVTNAMYALCVKDGKCTPPTIKKSSKRESYYGNPQFNNYPVVFVTWENANAYCGWAERRLPTEAEWEKAARGIDGRTYPWGNNSPNQNLLNYNDYVGDTTEVGKYPEGASVYGAMDMAGNVWEWVNDWYEDVYYSKARSQNPTGPILGQFHVMRGGSWGLNDVLRVSGRNKGVPTVITEFLGFRCAATP